MNRILVLSWFYPPCNLTAAQRTRAWGEYFHEKKIYPIIITRNWNIPIHETEDAHLPTGTELIIEKYDTHEVHILPYRLSIFSKVLNSKVAKIAFFKYPILLFTILFEHFFTSFTDYKDFFTYVKGFIKKNSDIKLVLISGAPFHLFKLGYQLVRDFKIKFVADYRDAWTDNEVIVLNIGLLDTLKRKIDQYFEKKWLSNATCFVTVSNYLRDLIANTIQKEGIVVYNGYFENDFKLKKDALDDVFTLVYSGSLYHKVQSLDILSEGVFKLIQKHKENQIPVNFKLIFLGAGWDSRAKVFIEKSFHKSLPYIYVTPRVDKTEASKVLINADCFLMVSYNKSKGIVSSKLFEYLYLQKPILNAPSDNDIVEYLTVKSGLGKTAQNSDDVCQILWELMQNRQRSVNPNCKFIEQFSRRNQTLFLADKLNQIINQYLQKG